ncbi:MAG TPA: hypothetical protein VM617_06370 [Thermoanaerobaculia bacterium]|nr:hypothetical protein [Thermoanaerobaculia bacterium]
MPDDAPTVELHPNHDALADTDDDVFHTVPVREGTAPRPTSTLTRDARPLLAGPIGVTREWVEGSE